MNPIDATALTELLARPEGTTLDFKATGYDLSNAQKKGEFLKDVLAMANTPRDEPGRIVLGVNRHPDGSSVVLGLETHVDDNIYQQQIEAHLYPTPVVLYHVVELQGARVGVLEIAPEQWGPYRAKNDIGPVRRNALYWRQGSKNAEVVHQGDEDRIRDWVSPSKSGAISGLVDDQLPQWDEFLASCHSFDQERLYILIAGPVENSDASSYSGLGAPPWFAVFDLDPCSSSSGLLAASRVRLASQRQIHEVVFGDRPALHTERSVYWIFARGLNGRASTLVEDNLRSWRLRYSRELRLQMDRLAASAGSRPVTAVVLCEADDSAKRAPFLDTLLEAAFEAFGTNLDAAICCDGSGLTELAQYHHSARHTISPKQLGRGLGQAFAPDQTPHGQHPTLPGRGGIPVSLNRERCLWLEEDLEVLHSSCGLRETTADATSRDFLCGGQISWFQLGMHDDVDRELSSQLLRQLRSDLGLLGRPGTGAVRVSLYHEPGTGGTTVARRALWDLHKEVPCVLTKTVAGMETGERIRSIYSETELPVLVLAEGASTTDAAIEELYSFLRAQQVPTVILRVLRSFQAPAAAGKGSETKSRSFYLRPELNQPEADRFATQFARSVPARRQQLDSLARTPGKARQPFFFGLTAFEQEFLGLAKFVSVRLDGISAVQQKILVFLALAYCYGQQTLPAHAFKALLGLDGSEKVDLAKAFPSNALPLLQNVNGHWRPIHQLVGEEILRQLLNSGDGDPRLWKQNLSHWAVEFAIFCRGSLVVPSVEMLEVVARCFLLRDASDPIGREESTGKSFSRLIEDIPSLDGRFAVLEKLTELFPDEAHIWAHLGRFVFRERKDPVRARNYIDKSIELSPEDPVLYHIKGMAFRAECYDAMVAATQQQPIVDISLELSKITPLVRLAAEQFGIAREKNPQDEHSYISHIQLLLRLVDTAKTALNLTAKSSAIVHPKVDAVVREALDEAEDLLERVRLLREGERPSEYAIRCAAGLDMIYGDYSAVLQAWDGLLLRKDMFKPPIRRQLVRAYLARHERDWAKLSQTELKRSLSLLEENLLEEPGEEKNLRLWVQAVRRVTPRTNINTIVERIAYWRANSDSVEAAYYLYVLHTILALDGSPLAAKAFNESLAECRRRARERRNRTGSFEWIGRGNGMERLIHHTELGQWQDAQEFWSGAEKLDRLRGRIVRISGPAAGTIETPGGLPAFFVPGRSNHVHSRDENREVSFCLGLSYDGPRAWEVENAQ